MGRREKYKINFNCPNCNKKGVAQFNESAYPVHGGGFDETMESVSEGFEIGDNKRSLVQCIECNKEFKLP